MSPLAVPWPRLLAVAALALAQGLDNRCYLENGGSAESFFVSEDLPVGAVIGAVRIFGDASEMGTVSLRLKEVDSPVRIDPGSKNITLTRRLDKEGIDGPSSVYVNVICDRKRTSDPGFMIPINIRVTDANDNAPLFVNAPYILNISEVTVVGTRVLQGVRAVDADQQGPYSTVQYTVLPGPNSDYFVFVNGLEGTLVLRKPLDYETLPNFTIAIRAQDQGQPPHHSDAQLHVNVIDADDQNPRFMDDRYSAIVPDHATQGTRLRINPREIAAFDQDIGINAPIFYSFNSAGSDYRYFELDRALGHVILKRNLPDDELLQPATLVVRATQYDNADRYALATLAISRPGTSLRELQFLQSHYLAGVLENVPLNSVLLTVITNRHRDKRLRFWLDRHTEMFAVMPTGDIILKRSLDFETRDSYIFHVHVTDSIMNTTASVNISVLNVNDWDPRFRYPQYEFFVSEGREGRGVGAGLVIGRVEVADGDRGDHVALSLRGPAARMFSVNGNGEITIRDLSQLNSSTAHLVAVATDTGVPPRQASVPVIVHLPEAVVWQAGWVTPGGSGVLMMTVFSALLGVLALIILVLIIYIHKHKRPKADNGSNTDIAEDAAIAEKLSQTTGLVGNPVFTGSNVIPEPTASQYTATVKSIMARNAMARQSQIVPTKPHHGKTKLAPAPPTLPHSPSPSPEANNNSSAGTASRSVAWPMGSIPRRVKKLSWGDENDPEQNSLAGTEPGTGGLKDAKTADHMNLTVYF